MSEEEDALAQFFGPMPGRPNHPDFWRLAEGVMRNDSMGDENPRVQSSRVATGRGPQRTHNPMDDIVDFDSINYMMDQRIARFLHFIGEGKIPKDPLEQSLKALYLDAWMAGYRFHESGGHRAR